jgi:hypothetical protein
MQQASFRSTTYSFATQENAILHGASFIALQITCWTLANLAVKPPSMAHERPR